MSERISKLPDDLADNEATRERAFEWARQFDWQRHLNIMLSAVVYLARSHERVSSEAATA